MVQPRRAQPTGTRRAAQPDGMIRYLVRAGLADQTAIGSPGTVVANLSRSHQVWSVRLPDGRHFIVKRARARPGETVGGLGGEIAFYATSSRDPRWREIVPACLLIDHRIQLLVLEAIEPAESLHAVSFANGPSPEHASMLGRALATAHQATAGQQLVGIPDATPWILKVFEPGQWRPPEIDRALVYGTERREIAGHFSGLLHILQPSCTIHGDLKWDNCLVSGVGVRIIDWETVGFGDPAWDVASVIQEYETFEIAAPHDRTEAGSTVDCQRALLSAWRATIGAQDDNSDNARIAKFSGARMIQTALEYAAMSPDERLPRAIVERGLALLRNPSAALWSAEAA